MRADQRLVFVGGLHRSGTTPFTSQLAVHELISGLTDTGVTEDEGQLLQDVYPRGRAHGGPGRFAFTPGAHLTEASPLATPENAARLLRAWEPYWDLSRPVLLEKSPPNLVMFRFLQALFPGSSMILVMRHPVVVALATQKWTKVASRNWRHASDLPSLVSHWLAAHAIVREDAPHVERLLTVRYEDVVADAPAAMERVRGFLDLPTRIPTDSWKASHNHRYQEMWDAMRTGSRAERRRRRAIEERHAESIASYGYDVDDLTTHRPWVPGS